MKHIAVLAVQGGFAAHAQRLEALGHHAVEARTAEAIENADGLVLPGGESSAQLLLIERFGLEAAIRAVATSGRPILATCAGMILAAMNVTSPEQRSFGLIDIDVARNAYGRQRDSFEATADRDSDTGEPLPLLFIRAPRILRIGANVDVLAALGGEPVLVRQRNVTAAAFHPELTADDRVHRDVFGPSDADNSCHAASAVSMASEHFDVLVIGAGISGIGAGYHLQSKCPTRTYAILEGRKSLGGTWDLFRYPGIRSDSDMYTLGYSFRPWTSPKAIADGPSILKYLQDTAAEYGIDKHIRYEHRVVAASWSSADARWTVVVKRGEAREEIRMTCNFLFVCAGYYDYEAGYTPRFEGAERFQGRIVHPQKWTSDVEYAGKRVVVIGSGATAVTLVPELAKSAAHVTMLQRSPTYIISRPSEDALANWMREHLPERVAYGLTRWKNVLLGMLFYNMSKKRPNFVKRLIRKGIERELGKDFDVATHFSPRYNPWDQRVCLVPDGDLFDALKSERASVVTDHIDTFTERGIRLKSGRELEADLVVTATGLELKALGGVDLSVDGEPVVLSNTMSYKGMMYTDVPNLASCIGYTNASWTLKCDLTCAYVCRLLNHLEKGGFRRCTPRANDESISREPWIDFSSGYIQRSVDKFPKQGSRAPWRLYQNYALDTLSLEYASIDDGAMEFSS
jgi:pyridoxal 5'-phosphate synthase glutaminase subunit Pdx2